LGRQADLHDPVHLYKVGMPAWQNVASVVLLAAGILLELVRSRAAKYINLGYFLALSGFALVVFLSELAGAVDAHGMSLIFFVVVGLPSLAVLAVDAWLYGIWRGSRSAA
jgi:hypothetical protein